MLKYQENKGSKKGCVAVDLVVMADRQSSLYRGELKKADFRPGISLVISVILISLIVTFSLGVGLLVVDSVRNGNRIKQGQVAFNNAESGMELALLVNKQLKDSGAAVGASESVTWNEMTSKLEQDQLAGFPNFSFKIIGTAEQLPSDSQKVNDKNIIPLPWTGDVPWHGEGSKAVSGGCDPFKKPTLTNSGADFAYPDSSGANGSSSLSAIDHPCNWGKLEPGKKISVPLYSMSGNTATSYSGFTLKLRTPCSADSKGKPREICQANERMELNCFYGGEERVKCSSADNTSNYKKGEVVVLWQVDAKNAGKTVTFSPNVLKDIHPTIGVVGPYDILKDSQLFEGRINKMKAELSNTFEVLSVLASNYFPAGLNDGNGPLALMIVDSSIVALKNVLSASFTQPVLKLTLVSGLMGCPDNTCAYGTSSTIPSNSQLPKIPYLEYQVVVSPTNSGNQSSLENVITAEGSSGEFVQSVQAKIAHQTGGVEYVIQQ